MRNPLTIFSVVAWTLILFGFVLRIFRAHLKKRSFLLLLTTAFALHVLLALGVVKMFGRVPPFFPIVFCLAEFLLIVIFFEKKGFQAARKQNLAKQ